MRKWLRIIFLFILGNAFMFCFFEFWYFDHKINKEYGTTKVVVAQHVLNERQVITENDIKMIEVLNPYLLQNTYIIKEDIIGKIIKTNTTIPSGSPFYLSMIEDISEIQDYPQSKLNKGQVAYSLSVDLVQLAGNTFVEDEKVDIYSVIQQRNELPVMDVLFTSVRIVAIKDRKGLKLDDPESTKVPAILVLAINADDVIILSKANKIGVLELYATDHSYLNEECILKKNSQVLTYLNETQIKVQ